MVILGIIEVTFGIMDKKMETTISGVGFIVPKFIEDHTWRVNGT